MKEEERQADSENFQVLPGLPHTHRAARIDCIRHFGPIWPQFQNSNGKNWLKSIICRLMRYARVWPGTQIRHWKSLSSRKIYWWLWKCRLIGTIFIWVNRTTNLTSIKYDLPIERILISLDDLLRRTCYLHWNDGKARKWGTSTIFSLKK